MAHLNFEKQNRGYQNRLHSYKMVIPFDLYENDLLVFHHIIEDELLRVIREESNDLGPLKLSYTMLVKLKKETNRGEEMLISSFFEIDFEIKSNAKKSRRFDLSEVIFK